MITGDVNLSNRCLDYGIPVLTLERLKVLVDMDITSDELLKSILNEALPGDGQA
jgi:hypothetical protein